MPAKLARGRDLAVFLAVFAVAYSLQGRSKGSGHLCVRESVLQNAGKSSAALERARQL